MTDDGKLLVEYARNGSEDAFRQLVSRYINLVYSAAVRQVGGNSTQAEDIVQRVFVDLARKARSLHGNKMLGGWLHRHTCYVAATVLRTERRRQVRERQAVEMSALNENDPGWKDLAPVLDDAINELGGEDRRAIVLRFLEQRDLQAVGEALGSSSDAAQKRVTRALEKLRLILGRRGVALSLSGLAATLGTEAVMAAPVGMAVSVSSTALAGAAAGAGFTFAVLKGMAMTKLKAGMVSVVVVAGVATPLVLQHQSQARLQQENETLRLQLAQVQEHDGQKSNLQTGLVELTDDQKRELLKLRGEINQLRGQTSVLEKLRGENQQLRSSLAKAAQETSNSAPGREAPTDFPRESWAFAGYADPPSAFQSLVWALSNGDVQTAFASVSPGERARMENRWANKSETEISAGVIKEFQNTKRFRVLDREVVSENEAILRIYVEGEKTPETAFEKGARLIKLGNDWKFDGWAKRRSTDN